MRLAVINGWRVLALKQLAQLDELKRSGRWQRLFSSEAAFDEAQQLAEANVRKWKLLSNELVAELDAARGRPRTIVTPNAT